jgi:hypothetical protein
MRITLKGTLGKFKSTVSKNQMVISLNLKSCTKTALNPHLSNMSVFKYSVNNDIKECIIMHVCTSACIISKITILIMMKFGTDVSY